MANYVYIGYAPGAIDFSGGTVSLDAGYDAATDRRIFDVEDAASGNTIGSGSNSHVDNGVLFDGDRFTNESGDDSTQSGDVTSLDGNTTYGSGQIYLEQSYTLTAAGEATVTIYRVEIAGNFMGYVASGPLADGVTYNYTTSNVMPNNAPDTSDPSAIVDIPCFVAGTLIETPDGLREIETLQAGDLVRNRAGDMVRLRWIGYRSIVPQFHQRQQLFPVRIMRGALGNGCPSRDLMVSPNHRVVMDGPEVELVFGEAEAFVAAKFLVGLPGIFLDLSVTEVSYVHLLFDDHQVIMAEGLASESLHPGDLALEGCGPDAAEEILYLFPSLKESTRDGYGPLALPALTKREALVCRDMRMALYTPKPVKWSA